MPALLLLSVVFMSNPACPTRIKNNLAAISLGIGLPRPGSDRPLSRLQ